MAKKATGDTADSTDSNASLVTTPEDQAKAKKWFARARELGEKRQFDYAIEYYVNGLEFWPDAVEEACKPLHGCAVARRQTGGKKPGLKDSMRRSLTDKDPKKAFMNTAWLFGHDPDNLNYVEAFVRNANRLRADETARWAAGVCLKVLESSSKASAKQFQLLVAQLEGIADRAAASENGPFGVEVFQMGVEAVTLWRRRMPKDRNAELQLKNMSTKLTILKGKYKDGGSFRGSVSETEEQMDRHDEQRSIQADERVEELIAKAEAAYQEDPADSRKLKSLIDLLCRREVEDDETKAIGLLVNAFKETGEYARKQAADDIRMKQLTRAVRVAAKSSDQQQVKERQLASLRFELGVFKDRAERYPTDNRIKFEFAVRQFRGGRLDDAIPLFQAARANAKNRTACSVYLGRCFFRKKFYSQAISTLEGEIKTYELADDGMAKTMLYWLGRSQEDSGDRPAAKDTYGKILQIDYNYKDVRARLEGLPE